MIPQPPFPWDFDARAEEAAFERLKDRLAALWADVFPSDEEHYTSVVVPSLTIDPEDLRTLEGVPFQEERLLFLLIRLRNPRARMVYVTSQPIHPLVLEYYLQLLAGIPASHARSHLTLLCAHDASRRPLTEKVLERPRLVQRIRAALFDPSRAYLTVFNTTPLERRLAVVLDIPLNGADPRLLRHGTRSGGRRIFHVAGVSTTRGVEGLRDRADVVDALTELGRADPGLARARVKLDTGFFSETDATFTYPAEGRSREAIAPALRHLAFASGEQTPEIYLDRLERTGAVVEEVVPGPVASPSVQLRINPRGKIILISTHDRILGGPLGLTDLGCRFPADATCRGRVQEAGLRVGQALAAEGVVSRFDVHFVARPGPTGWDLKATDLHLRMGATTHPFLALRFLTGGQLDPVSGEFRAPSGVPKYYRSTDSLHSPAYRGLLPEDLIDIVTVNRLGYDGRTETGVLFHLIGAVSEFGRLGLTAIGNTANEAEQLFAAAVTVLDRETARDGPQPGRPGRLA